MKYRHILVLVMAALVSVASLAKDITVDDSYSPGERFARYKASHPELEWPVQTFRAGQSIAFERP